MGDHLCRYLDFRVRFVELSEALLWIPYWLDGGLKILVILLCCLFFGLLFVELITCLNLRLSLDILLVSLELACRVFLPLLFGFNYELFASFLPVLGFLYLSSSDFSGLLLEGLPSHDVLFSTRDSCLKPFEQLS